MNMKNLHQVIIHLQGLRNGLSAQDFHKKLDECLDFYDHHIPKHTHKFIERTATLCESWYINQIKLELQTLLSKRLLQEAERLYLKNAHLIDKGWYKHEQDRSTRRLKVVKLKKYLKEIEDLQQIGRDRTVWDQPYPRKCFDEKLISRLSDYIHKVKAETEISDSPWEIEDRDVDDNIYWLEKKLKDEVTSEQNLLHIVNSSLSLAVDLQNLAKQPKPSLQENDFKLISQWSNRQGGSAFSSGAMRSAREAEVAAIKIYGTLNGKAKDLSILQITAPKADQWQYADIETEGRWIDVKNARTSFGSKNSYSEHCVPQFKLDRNKNNVFISGFLSSYKASVIAVPIRWLGESSIGQVAELQKEFNSKYLDVNFTAYLNKSFLPPWLFDYPTECYKQRNEAIHYMRSEAFCFPRKECSIGAAILAKRLVPNSSKLLTVEAEKLQHRIDQCGLRRPVVFLHLVDRFCRCLLEGQNFSDIPFDRILFVSPMYKNNPLGIYDPLATVWHLWTMLLSVFQNCPNTIKDYTMFRLRGPNVLQGRTSGNRWTTIFAYCGGWQKINGNKSVRCGQNPLYLGQNSSCSTCGHLICHKCNFCSEQCRNSCVRQG